MISMHQLQPQTYTIGQQKL